MLEYDDALARLQRARREESVIALEPGDTLLAGQPRIDGTEPLRAVLRAFQIRMAIMHRDQNAELRRAANCLDLGVLEDVLSSIDRHHQDVHAAQLLDIALGQRAIVSQMRDPQLAYLDPPDRVFLPELLTPRIGGFPRTPVMWKSPTV